MIDTAPSPAPSPASSGGPSATPSAPPRGGRRDRLRYRFDLALSRGPSVVIGWLGLLTLAIIVVTALVLTLFRLTGVNGEDGKDLGVVEAIWQSMLRVVDAGTFAGDVGWVTRIVGLMITVAGIFLAGSLIGLIANAVDQRIEELRKGRSHVIEHDHTVILGWSTRVTAIVSELVIANESRKHATVVVLAGHDKTEMEETLRLAIPDLKTTRLVCRSGEPWMPRNLELVNLAVGPLGGRGRRRRRRRHREGAPRHRAPPRCATTRTSSPRSPRPTPPAPCRR